MDNFLDQVETLLYTKSQNELKALILKIADKIPGLSMQEFLTLLENKRVIISSEKTGAFSAPKALDRIKELYENVEDYDIEAHYYEGYEWDEDEHGEGYNIESDDGFTDEYYACYTGAVSILEHGFYKEAAEAFDTLFRIIEKFDDYHENDDEGEFFFETFIDEEMLEIDLMKMAALKGYSALMARPGNLEDVLTDIFDILEKYSGKLMFKDILNAGSEAVEHVNEVLNTWVTVLYGEPVETASKFVKEAALLLEKPEIMEAYVDKAGANVPQAYIDLCDLYFSKGQTENDKIVAVAMKGLQNTDKKQANRDKLAGILAAAANGAKDKDAYRYAVLERFYSHLSLENYMPVLELGDKGAISDAIEYLDKSFKTDKDATYWSRDRDYYIIRFLNKDYDLVYGAINADHSSLGWSSSVKGLMIPFFMGLLTGFSEKAAVIRRLIEEKITLDMGKGAFYKILRENMGEVSKVQDKIWYARCVKETEDRVVAIVSAQHRGSYGKAARLLAAISEIRIHRGEDAPYQIIYTYLAKYPRHTAFRAEVRTALADAGFRGIKV